MKVAISVLFCLSLIAGCGGENVIAPNEMSSLSPISTDLQNDLWHAHRHVHDEIQLHDHEHKSGFEGGHAHPHGHAHRHAETLLGGIVVSLQRVATPGQLPGRTISAPVLPHLEILPGLPASLELCFLTESKPTGWSYWNPNTNEITVVVQVEGTSYKLACQKKLISGPQPTADEISSFKTELPESLRQRLAASKARLRIAKFSLYVENIRFKVREQVYFQGEELSVFLE